MRQAGPTERCYAVWIMESEASKLMRPSRKRIEGNTLGCKSSVLRHRIFGRVTERLMVLAWKAMRCNSHAGSNPVSSAIWRKYENQLESIIVSLGDCCWHCCHRHLAHRIINGEVTSQGAGPGLNPVGLKGWVSTTHLSAIWSLL